MSSEITNTDRVFCGIFYTVVGSALAIHGIAAFIEACRSRPKVQAFVLAVGGQDDGGGKAKVEAVGAQEAQA